MLLIQLDKTHNLFEEKLKVEVKQMKSTNFIKKLRKEESIAIFETEDIKKLTAKDAMIKPVFVHHLICEDTMDEQVMSAIKAKDNKQESLMTAVKALITKYST